MNQNERAVLVDAFLMKALSLMRAKGAAYSGTEDVNTNFKNAGTALGMTKYQSWGNYAKKHIDCIFNAIKDNPEAPVDNTESLEGRITDLLNYALILYTMLHEDGLVDEMVGEFDYEDFLSDYEAMSQLKPVEVPINPNIKMEVKKHED